MKKWFAVAVFVLLAGAGFSQGTDYSDPEGAYPVQLALFFGVANRSGQPDVLITRDADRTAEYCVGKRGLAGRFTGQLGVLRKV